MRLCQILLLIVRLTSAMVQYQRSEASLQAEGCIVVGGGIAGLATAVALRKMAGVASMTVLEACSAEHFEDDMQGAALQLGPNGLKALRAIGGENLMNQVIHAGTKITGNEVHLPQQTLVIPDTTEERTGLPQVLLRWSRLRDLLKEQLGQTEAVTGKKVSRTTETIDGILQLFDADDNLIAPVKGFDSTSMVVGADGIHSSFAQAVRGGLNIKDNGRVNLKAVAPLELTNHDGKTRSFFAADGSVACFAGPAGDGFTYWAVSIADAKSNDGNIVRFADEDPDLGVIKDTLLQKLQEINAPSFTTELITATDSSRIFVRRSEESVEIGPSLAKGHVVLVGDAAHAMSPSFGQSPNLALEDAATLADCIVSCPSELKVALENYSRARMIRCSEMVRRSSERTAKASKGEAVTEDIWEWIFNWDLLEH